ncbi:YrhA family protein [Bacillus carboniphilus]|uniref:YrhA family protein n=1 Tax=Bacillus carboniphilus TaxID=86663 RepID=A0ABY9JTG1_9BACI|nr:YrhA family protein [Bacillus carboniphilus]WLR42627.1 YrhA family protein [Bacillus carboniphilus]
MIGLLKKIENIKNTDEKSIFLSASEESILTTKKWIFERYKKNIWLYEYENFLRLVNGLDFNGLVIYGAESSEDSNSLIGANEIWLENEWDKNYLFFGDSSISWYCVDVDDLVFYELDKPSGEIVEEYNSFEGMVNAALNSVL